MFFNKINLLSVKNCVVNIIYIDYKEVKMVEEVKMIKQFECFDFNFDRIIEFVN